MRSSMQTPSHTCGRRPAGRGCQGQTGVDEVLRQARKIAPAATGPQRPRPAGKPRAVAGPVPSGGAGARADPPRPQTRPARPAVGGPSPGPSCSALANKFIRIPYKFILPPRDAPYKFICRPGPPRDARPRAQRSAPPQRRRRAP